MDKLLTVFNEKDINGMKSAITSILETNVPGTEIKFHEVNGYLAETEDGEVYENVHFNLDVKFLGQSLENCFK